MLLDPAHVPEQLPNNRVRALALLQLYDDPVIVGLVTSKNVNRAEISGVLGCDLGVFLMEGQRFSKNCLLLI
jgi:hypothetical protein